MKVLIGFIFVSFFIMLVWHPGPYNTEQVCFDDSGEIVFYASGFNPNETPMVRIIDGVYKDAKTGEKLNATCRWSWGANPPKGREHWESGQ